MCAFLIRRRSSPFICFVSFIFVCFLKLELAEEQGVSMNCYYVTTEDGYILRLYHIPPPPQIQSDKPNDALKPMLFMHGLQTSSLDFVFYPNVSAGEFAANVFELFFCFTSEKGVVRYQNVWIFKLNNLRDTHTHTDFSASSHQPKTTQRN